MYYYDDPISGDTDIAVTDIASAFYAMKICNDDFFSVQYQGQEMWKELNRLGTEIHNRKYALVSAYLPKSTDTATSSTVIDPPKIIPATLPSIVPQSVKNAMKYLDEQYARAEEILQAELAEDTADLKDTIARLEAKVTKWFSGEVQRRAAWLGGGRTATFAGCTIRYSGGDVSFSYKELDDEED